MKNFSLNKAEELQRLKEALNKVLDKRIDEKLNKDSIESVDFMNLGELVCLFESVSDKTFDNRKDLLGKYITTIKENTDLKRGFKFLKEFDECNRKSLKGNNCAMLVLETVNTYRDDIDAKNLAKGEKELRKIVKECLQASGVDRFFIEDALKEANNLSECIEYLMMNGRDSEKLNERCECLKKMVRVISEEEMLDDTTESTPVDANTENGGDTMTQLQELLTKMDGEESAAVSNVVRRFVKEQLKGLSNEEIFNNLKNECLNNLNKKMEDCTELSEKMQLESLRGKLEGKVYCESTFHEDAINMGELSQMFVNESK